MKAGLQKAATHSRPKRSSSPDGPFHGGKPQFRAGKPSDKFEREADAMADRVVSGESRGGLAHEVSPVRGLDLARQPMDREGPEESAQLQEEEEAQTSLGDGEQKIEEGDETPLAQKQELQTQTAEKKVEGQAQADADVEEMSQASAAAQPAVYSPKANIAEMIRRRRGRGSPLPEPVRSRMEQQFSADFTGVRIHPDEAELTQILGAQALTSGQDIFFGRNRFNPTTRTGEHLLAHELTHTIQQGAARVRVINLERPAIHRVQNQQDERIQAQQDDEEDGESYLVRPELLQAIRLARTQIGKVDANTTNADGTRVGWERLLEYFRTAFGGEDVIDPEVIKRKIYRNLPVHGSNTSAMRDAMPSWCGIFVWWALKKSGIPIPDWKLGVSAFRQFETRGPRELPQKGDMAHAHDRAHWAMVTGVESTGKAAGKPFANVMVRTINGNTAGEDVRGGQVQELWHPISRWIGFFNPVARLNMPPVELVRTGREPDADEGVPEVPTEKHGLPRSDIDKVKNIEDAPPEPPPEDRSTVAVDLPPPVMQGSPDEVAEIPKLDMKGSSDQAVVKFTDSTASQMAVNLPDLGTAVTNKSQAEKKSQADNPPVLTAKTAGKVEGGLTPPSELAVPGDAVIRDAENDHVNPLEPGRHQDHFAAPSTAGTREKIKKQPRESLLTWLKKNMLNLISGIRVRDKGVNTSAGPRQKVRLEGQADPDRIRNQRLEANRHLTGRRDEVTEKLRHHPGQTNIQAKAVEVETKVAINPEPGENIVTRGSDDTGDYVTAPLPEDVRAGADAEIAKSLGARISGARKDTETAAQTRDTDRNREIDNARTETARLNSEADNEQRRIVLGNRARVAKQQAQGIRQAYGEVDTFRKESDSEQRKANARIRHTTRSAEDKAHSELKKAEDESERRKKVAEQDAASHKKKLEKEDRKKSWWDRGVDFVKSVVDKITAAIDGIFTALRKGIAKLINAARAAAVKFINAARIAIVGLLDGFRNWAKNQVNKYLKDKFPRLAAAINSRIDATVDLAIAGVNRAADVAIKGVEALAGFLGKALDKILATFQTALKAAVQIAGAVVTGDLAGALRIAIKAACDIAGIDSKPIFDFMDRAGKQIRAILKAPRRFFNNLFRAVGSGVNNFVKNIKKHLIGGLIGWLTGALSEVEITLPEKFDVKGIFSLAMQILGLTYQNIRARVVKRFPPAEKVFSAIEKGVEVIRKIREGGIAALWGEVKQAIGNFREMVLGAIRGFVITTVVKEAVTWLLSLLNPAAAIVKLVKLLFDFVMFLVERFMQIKNFVLSVYNTLADAASGAFAKVSQGVEDAMARSLPVVISLLARLAGLGGIGKTVQKIIGKVARPVNKVIDKVVDKVIGFARKLLRKGKQAGRKVAAKLARWWKVRRNFKGADGKNHSLFFKGRGQSAVLTVRSDERTFSQFLSLALKRGDADKNEIARAREIAKQVDDTKARKLKGKNETEKKEDSKKKKAEVERLTGKLEKHTRVLFPSLPESKVVWGSPTGAKFGSSMKAEILTTKRDRNEPKLVGSGPTTAKHDVYDRLNKRRQQGSSSYYIRGHLLNDNVGGPGKWFNMTPLTRKANKLHEKEVESTVKGRVHTGSIMEYHVVPKYASRSDSNAIISKAGAGLSQQDKNDIRDIVKAEEHVPTQLSIRIAAREKKKGRYQSVSPRSPVIPNDIDRSPDSYFLTGGRTRIKPIDVNNLTGPGELKSDSISENLRKNADVIWEAIRERQQEPGDAMFGTYAALTDASKVAISANDQEFLVLRPRKNG